MDEQIIYHIVPAGYYDGLSTDQPYVSERFAEEGFIHCTKDEERVLLVANTLYRKTRGKFWLLVIDERRVQPEIRYEIVGEILFPHIYGALNRDAILRVQEMARAQDGTFLTIGAPPPPEPLSVHPAALAAEASIEDVLAETRRLRQAAVERIAALEQEIEAFRQGRPIPPSAPSAPAKVAPDAIESLSKRVAALEQQVAEDRVKITQLSSEVVDALTQRVAALERRVAERQAKTAPPSKAKPVRPRTRKTSSTTRKS